MGHSRPVMGLLYLYLLPTVQEAGWAPGPVWTGVENLTPTGIRSPDRPARSKSLYRLSYPAHSSPITNKMSNYHNNLSILRKHMEETVGIFAVTGTEYEVKDKGNKTWGWRWFHMSSYATVWHVTHRIFQVADIHEAWQIISGKNCEKATCPTIKIPIWPHISNKWQNVWSFENTF
jgi:hypothetical protein